MRARPALLPALCALALGAAACPQEKNVRPTLRIVSPVDGSSLSTSSVVMQIAVTNFEITNNVVNSEPFKGHWHLYIDFIPVASILTTSAAISEIPAGTHVFSAELSNENDVPVSGVPVQSVTVDFPGSSPFLALTQPPFGASISSSSVDVALDLSNFVLDSAAIGGPNAAGHGHYQYYVGGLDPSQYAGDDSRAIGTLTDIDTSGSTDTLPEVEIWVTLVNNDGTQLDPVVFDRTVITVPKTSPRIRIDSPIANAVVGNTFDLALSVANFSLVDFAGAPADSSGQGHYRVLVDGSDLGPAFLTSSTGWSSQGSGNHRVRVELVTNTGAPLAQPVVDEVLISKP